MQYYLVVDTEHDLGSVSIWEYDPETSLQTEVVKLGRVDLPAGYVTTQASKLLATTSWSISGAWDTTADEYMARVVRTDATVPLAAVSIIVPGVDSDTDPGDGTRITETGITAINDLIAAELAKRYPKDRFVMIPGGRGNDDWNRLMYGYGMTTADAVGITLEVESITQCQLSDEWQDDWTEPREMAEEV